MSARARVPVVAIWAVGFVAPAFAETWTAKVNLDMEKTISPQPCLHTTISYTFELANNIFMGTNQFGRMFSIPVPADGVIKQTYWRPMNGVQKKFEIAGNVKSKDLEISQVMSTGDRCYYKVTPD